MALATYEYGDFSSTVERRKVGIQVTTLQQIPTETFACTMSDDTSKHSTPWTRSSFVGPRSVMRPPDVRELHVQLEERSGQLRLITIYKVADCASSE